LLELRENVEQSQEDRQLRLLLRIIHLEFPFLFLKILIIQRILLDCWEYMAINHMVYKLPLPSFGYSIESKFLMFLQEQV
jgi:hypothetical protein